MSKKLGAINLCYSRTSADNKLCNYNSNSYKDSECSSQEDKVPQWPGLSAYDWVHKQALLAFELVLFLILKNPPRGK